ncbi:hypothetical protein E3N88_19267 [Mikania micrantha]|uniref:Pentacotripeptide-repeat region of PRORP domain-containing protein n=1 Tax=Mikania micrantha TaxID=192012 RepID=A0A5N6NMQ3_9ASTR|nr:hypothetical protein E3N88_19267 [Mikania micrantha]
MAHIPIFLPKQKLRPLNPKNPKLAASCHHPRDHEHDITHRPSKKSDYLRFTVAACRLPPVGSQSPPSACRLPLAGCRLLSSDYLRLVNAGDLNLAENLYIDRVLKQGLKPDASLLNSMMICYCKLGKIKEENDHVEKLLGMTCYSARHFSELIGEVFDQNRLTDAYDYCVRINDAAIFLAVSCYNMLIAGLSFRGYVDEALHVFDIMLERGVLPVCHLWKSLVFGFCKTGRVEEAELLSIEMESHGFFVDKVMYTSLINGYCKNRKVKMGMRLFYKMLKMGCQPDTYTYNTLMHGLVNFGFFDKIWVLHTHMIELGLEPDVLTYQIMINKFCKENKVDCALALFSSMCGRGLIPNVHCYTSIIPTLYKESRMEVDEICQKMLDSGVIPDQVMFFKLVKEYPKGYELHLTLMFLNAIAKYGCGIDSLQSSVSFGPNESIGYQIDHILGKIVDLCPHLANMAYSIYIIGLCLGGKSDDALRVVIFMINLGFQPLISAYNSLIKCFSQDGFVEHSSALIELMEGMGMIPNSTTFLISHIECDHITYISLVSGICRNLQCYNGKFHDNLNKSQKERDRLFHLLCQNSSLMENVSKVSITTHEDLKLLAMKLIRGVKDSLFMPNLYLHNAILSGFCRMGKFGEAYDHLDVMEKQGVGPNQVTFTILINGHIQAGEINAAVRLFNRMNADGCFPDRILYNILIKGLCKNKRLLDALSLSHAMCKRGFVPSKIAYEYMLVSLCASRLVNEALNLCEDMISHNYLPCRYNGHWLLHMLHDENKLHEAQMVCDLMLKKGRNLSNAMRQRF